MRRFICLLLVFALCVSLFTLPTNAATADGSFSSIKLIGADSYTRSISGDFRVVDDQLFQTYLMAAYQLNFQCAMYFDVFPFSTATVRLNDSTALDLTTISFKTGSGSIDGNNFPDGHATVGGIVFPVNTNVSYNNIFYSIFPEGMNYSANSPADGSYVTYYLPKDLMGSLIVADLQNSSGLLTLISQLNELSNTLATVKTHSYNTYVYATKIFDRLGTINTNIVNLGSYVTQINNACSNIVSRLEQIASYDAVSADQLTEINALLTEDMPTIIEDIEIGLDFLYSMDQKLYQISNKLSLIHNDLQETNDFLESIEEHLNAEALKGYDTNTGMNFFELAGNVLGNGFNVIGSFFSYAFMSISALLAPGLEGFDKIANIWSWNNSGYDPDYIVPDSGGG